MPSSIPTNQQQTSKPQRHASQPFIIVGCLIGNAEGKILFIIEGGKWNQPAGWLELGESLIAGAKREAEEEIGLEVAIDGLLGISTLIKRRPGVTLHAVKVIYRAHLTGGSDQTSGKLPFRWFTVDEVETLKGQLWEPDVIQEAEDFARGISYDLGILDHSTEAS